MTFSFHLMPLGFTIEQTITTEQAQIVAKKPKRVVFTVRLPNWFCQQQYDLQLQRASSGWTYTLGFCRIVPTGSPFFIACREGRIDEVKKLLSSGQASIYDRDEDDGTALYGAILDRRLDVCTLLRREGIFTRLQHEDLRGLLEGFAMTSIGPMESENSFYALITPPGNEDEHWFSEMLGKGNFVNDYFVALRDICTRSATEKLGDLDRFLRLRMDWILFLAQGTGPPFIRNLCPFLTNVLCDKAVLREIEARPNEYTWVVHAISWAYTIQTPMDCETKQLMTSILASAVRAGLDLHQTSCELPSPWLLRMIFESSFHGDAAGEAMNITPLGAMCLSWLSFCASESTYFTFPKDCVRLMNKRLQIWISSVQSLGTDLVKYGEREAPKLRGYLRLYGSTWWNGGQTFTLYVGPNPADWNLSLWNPCETYARHFWQLMTGEPVLDHMARSILVRKGAMSQFPFDDAEMPGAWRDGCNSAIERVKDSLMISANFVIDSMESDLLNFSNEAFFRKYELYEGKWVIRFLELWLNGSTGRGVMFQDLHKI